jgi:hypothetical protein
MVNATSTPDKGLHIVDTFADFLDYWQRAKDRPLDAQLNGWQDGYMAPWPELLQKQLDDYAGQGESWQAVAQEHVFPFLAERLPAMKTAHANLLRVGPDVVGRARRQFGFERPLIFVVYVGIGCGAGWVTEYDGRRAVLFGLENIAECGWSRPPALTGLVAHELGHLVHFAWRAEAGPGHGQGAWWQLLSEGFAQYCEHLILGRESWHMQTGNTTEEWLAWCRGHEPWLARAFLEAADGDKSVRPFFGSWYDLRGHKQTGYYLGHQLIGRLEGQLSLQEIALLDESDGRLRQTLEQMARGV